MTGYEANHVVNFKIIFLTVAVLLAGAVSIDAAHADTVTYPSPLQQQRDRIPVDAIQCNAPRELYMRDSQTPVCISASAYELLLERGVDLVLYQSFARTIYTITDAGEPEVRRVVEETVRMYDLDRENAFVNINGLSENIVLHYPFVLNPDTGNVVAHGVDPDRIGTQSVILGDYTDKPYDVILKEMQSGAGTWVDYIFLDPVTNEDGLKRSWLVLHDGHIFGAGFYYSIEDKMNLVVDNAIDLYDKSGFGAVTALHAKSSAHYPFVLDPTTGRALAHAGFPEAIGAVPPPSTTTDTPFPVIAKAMEETGESSWRYITFTNPTTGMEDQKRILYKFHDGYIFGAGYYYPAADKTMSVVEDVINVYKTTGRENAFASVTAQSENITPHYPFVIDPANGSIVAHGAFPENVGTQSVIMGGHADKTSQQILTELQGGDGTWVKYVYQIPGTDFEEKKRSYLQMHDGYIFGAGYYFSAFTVIPSLDANP